MLKIYEVVLEMARDVAVLCEKVERKDADLARQMRRAMTSVGLNVAEGMYSQGRNRRARYYTALGSAREVLAAVEIARVMRALDAVGDDVLDRMDHVISTLVRLTRG